MQLNYKSPVISSLHYFWAMVVRRIIIWALVVLVMAAAGACRKNQQVLTAGGIINFSDDTLKFDTVFTAAGSFTTGVMIFNPQNDAVVLSSVRMENGTASFFHLNVDGFQGNVATNIKIAGHDSIYVFATVKIDPTDTLTPFLITDRLVATMNGKEFSIPFTAYGQNAHYIINDSITQYTRWLTDKPYVVINKLAVGPYAELNIPGGCRVYMHQNARIFNYGLLIVDSAGIPGKDSVVFQGDRLDRAYFGYIGYPGEWGGLYFVGGSGGVLKNTVLKNCGGSTAYYYYGINSAAIQLGDSAVLFMDHSKIENAIGYGIYSEHGLLYMNNCLLHTTGAQALAIVKGGYDSITNCTFANYGTQAVTHNNNGTVNVQNYIPDAAHPGKYFFGSLDGVMQNCLVYGSLDSEIICDSVPDITARFRMQNCLLKMGDVRESWVNFTNCIFNQDPKFKNTSNGDFHLSAGSPCIGSGGTFGATGIYDLDGTPWGGSNDIGCYRRP